LAWIVISDYTEKYQIADIFNDQTILSLNTPQELTGKKKGCQNTEKPDENTKFPSGFSYQFPHH